MGIDELLELVVDVIRYFFTCFDKGVEISLIKVLFIFLILLVRLCWEFRVDVRVVLVFFRRL